MDKKNRGYIIGFSISLLLIVGGVLIFIFTLFSLGLILYVIGLFVISGVTHYYFREVLKRKGYDPATLTAAEKSQLDMFQRVSGFIACILAVPMMIIVSFIFTELIILYPLWILLIFVVYILFDSFFYLRKFKSFKKRRPISSDFKSKL